MSKKKKFYVVVYDIRADRSRDKVSKLLEKYGIRVNYSVFECLFTEKQLLSVQEKVDKIINKRCDAVIYYHICLDCYTKIIYQPRRIVSPKLVDVV
ncbi:CRISPR-associated endonuclease Cas2 [Bacteroides sp.]|uniref:CRISPR-associated endonuclease Cas2 n=1 Tax=Bacteroides sp. TaxID=29523 RepID=UPI0023C06104|nr:CRISPR-associated endonuclease Cas2 [Bacteroides sp.]MDE6215664.1 CRISPR-associated endonuclease Cas2 [Bacteroides sp.]